MEKLLLAIDAIHPDKNALDFACFLGRLTKSKVVGVFLENMEEEERPVQRYLNELIYADVGTVEEAEKHEAKLGLIQQHIAHFKEGCTAREVNCQLLRDRGIPTRELVEESRFADVMVIDATTSFKKGDEGTPTEFVRDILYLSECPVCIAPGKLSGIDEIVFAYNRNASSMFAIKQFTYLFPQLAKKKVSVVHVNETGEWEGTDKYKLKEWLKTHYTDIHFELLKGDGDLRLFETLRKRKNAFLVMGAYGRSAFSQFFKESHADPLIKTNDNPLFIAHL